MCVCYRKLQNITEDEKDDYDNDSDDNANSLWFKKVRSALEQQVMLKLQSYEYQEPVFQGYQIRLPGSPYYYEISHRFRIFDLSNEILVLL